MRQTHWQTIGLYVSFGTERDYVSPDFPPMQQLVCAAVAGHKAVTICGVHHAVMSVSTQLLETCTATSLSAQKFFHLFLLEYLNPSRFFVDCSLPLKQSLSRSDRWTHSDSDVKPGVSEVSNTSPGTQVVRYEIHIHANVKRCHFNISSASLGPATCKAQRCPVCHSQHVTLF